MMFGFLLREELLRLKRELVSWRGLVVLVLVAYIAMDIFSVASEGGKGFASFGSTELAGYWLLFLFPLRLGKMFYLLPFSRREQKSYVIQKVIVSLVYVFVFLLVCGGVFSLFTENPVACMAGWVSSFVSVGLPLLIYVEAMLLLNRSRGARANYGFFTTRVLSPEADEFDQMTAGWTEGYDFDSVKESLQNSGKTEQREREAAEEKKENRRESAMYVGFLAGLIFLVFGGIFLPVSEHLTVYIVFVAVAYVIAIVSIVTAFRVIFREIDGEEKPQKGGDGCSL